MNGCDSFLLFCCYHFLLSDSSLILVRFVMSYLVWYKHLIVIFTCLFNPFRPNGISLSYQLDQSISMLRVSSDLGLHCLHMSHKKDASIGIVTFKGAHLMCLK